MSSNKKAFFWAKTTAEGKPGISVSEHMLNVGSVALRLAEISPTLLCCFNLQATTVGALAALHDLGKISPGFQRKCEAWLEANDLNNIDRNCCWDTAMEADHGKVSHAAMQSFLMEAGIDRTTAKYVSAVIGAHHGRLSLPNDRGYKPQKGISEPRSGIDWNLERMMGAREVWSHFTGKEAPFVLDDSCPALWWLAGLTSVADWIGSDERFFPSEPSAKILEKSVSAQEALEGIGFHKIEVIKGLSFHDLFHDEYYPEREWIPNEMQEKALNAIDGPGVYVIEAPMGMGKTEAALWAAYKLLCADQTTGVYFALPTQATSNRMHLRMQEFVERICRNGGSSRLIHGNSWLMDKSVDLSPGMTSRYSQGGDARKGRDWFASSKRALIAPFGVGTIDQALLGIVASKHFFVRHYALAGKVVILDEIHSYDLYTGTLIDKLITTLEALGCIVIVLSATLSGKRRDQILSCSEKISDVADLPYPLIIGRKDGQGIESMSATPPEVRTVQIDFIETSGAAREALDLACKGGVVLWICNTIGAAQAQYQLFKEITPSELPIGLLHSRFPFWRREEIENEWLERLGKNGTTRCGSILVSTQIVEQSVDLDADLIITELAPTDMLLQRLGRLWRHKRDQRQCDKARLYIIKEKTTLNEFRDMEPMSIVEALGGKAHVYEPFVLLRTLQLWESHSKLTIPAQIRELIEETYRDRDDDPPAWHKLFDERFVRNSNERFIAARNTEYWQPQLPDAEGVQTRLNDVPTLSLVLCQWINNQEAMFIDGTKVRLGIDKFSLFTAQSIQKNLVKVPEYCFDSYESDQHIAEYLSGNQGIGVVDTSGKVRINGLNSNFKMYYFSDLGLVIAKSSEKEKK